MAEKGHLILTYQYLGIATYRQISSVPIPSGDVKVKILFGAAEPQPGTGGNVTLWANDRQIGAGRMPQTVSLLDTTYAGMDMGRDNGGVVDPDEEHKAPYSLTGKVKQVIFDLMPMDDPSHIDREYPIG